MNKNLMLFTTATQLQAELELMEQRTALLYAMSKSKLDETIAKDVLNNLTADMDNAKQQIAFCWLELNKVGGKDDATL